MNDPTDNPLNDRLRQLLDGHEAVADSQHVSQDWQLLRPRLFPHRQRPFLWFWSVGLLCLVGGVGWYLFRNDSPENAPVMPQKAVLAQKKATTPLVMSDQQTAGLPDKTSPAKATVWAQERVRQMGNPGYRDQAVPPVSVGQTVVIAEPAVEDVTPMAGIGTVKTITKPWPVVANRVLSAKEQALEDKLLSGEIGADSTVFAALSRNLRQWPNAVIVCDLTTSMDPYAAQIYAWFRRNAKNPQVRGVVFFTDCDSLGQETHPNGPLGAFFTTHERDPRAALPTLLAAARNTANNRDTDENVVEALRYAQRTFPEARHLVLLADNSSGVKDMPLLAGVKKPVHVVACGATLNNADAFQPDHYQIAQQTGGSIHTLEDDFTPTNIPRNTIVRVGEHFYRYSTRRGRFVKTRFNRRPVVVLGVRL